MHRHVHLPDIHHRHDHGAGGVSVGAGVRGNVLACVDLTVNGGAQKQKRRSLP
jgi:hypothetical protein